jgi:hypothetical protein
MSQDLTGTPSPKDAVKNLVKSVQTPLIWFGVGIAATLIFQARRKKVL